MHRYIQGPEPVKKVKATSTTHNDDEDSSGDSANEGEWLRDALRRLQRQKTVRVRSSLHKGLHEQKLPDSNNILPDSSQAITPPPCQITLPKGRGKMPDRDRGTVPDGQGKKPEAQGY